VVGVSRAILATGALFMLAGAASAADTRTATDSAGRRVEVPARVERVYAAGEPASIFLYTLAPTKMLGWTRSLGAEERVFVPARYAELPTLGRLTGRGNTANVEVVLAARPDLIFDYGSLTDTYRSLADRVQQQTGVPYCSSTGASPPSRMSTRAWAICSVWGIGVASWVGTRRPS
jgi:iron complex transport system substrate-binding protein